MSIMTGSHLSANCYHKRSTFSYVQINQFLICNNCILSLVLLHYHHFNNWGLVFTPSPSYYRKKESILIFTSFDDLKSKHLVSGWSSWVNPEIWAEWFNIVIVHLARLVYPNQTATRATKIFPIVFAQYLRLARMCVYGGTVEICQPMGPSQTWGAAFTRQLARFNHRQLPHKGRGRKMWLFEASLKPGLLFEKFTQKGRTYGRAIQDGSQSMKRTMVLGDIEI